MVPRPYMRSEAERERLWAGWKPAPLLQESDDWRLVTARDLAGLTFHWARWHRPSETWDHDHCAGCWAKFMEESYPGVLHEGWTTGDDWPSGPEAEWVCPTCFEELKPFLGWTAAKDGDEAGGPEIAPKS